MALVILAKCHVRPDGKNWRPYAVEDSSGELVGLLAMALDDTTCELYHLVVDQRRQGVGFGRGAVRAATDLVSAELPHLDEMRRTVHPDNDAAQRLSRSLGFRPTGEGRDGEPVWSPPLRGDRAASG